MTSNGTGLVELKLATGGVVRVETLAEDLFRVRLRPDEKFKEAALVRYGIFRDNWPAVKRDVEETGDVVTIRTQSAALSISQTDGKVTLRDGAGKVLLKQAEPPFSDPEEGFNAEFELFHDERFYGLGDETREQIQKRGHRAEMWTKNVECYLPIPFLMSSRGWGLLLNSTWRHYFDLGHEKPDRMRFGAKGGELDYYLFVGAGLLALLDRYTDLTGKAAVLPLWAYGLTWVCHIQAGERDVLDDCLNYRREHIPCDLVGLEPGWMESMYDYTVEKKWHPDRFYIPWWAPTGPGTFSAAMKRLGFKLSLWLCCDYDITHYEEQLLRGEVVSGQDVAERRHEDDEVKDPHLVANLMDKLTKPDEPWFEHLKPFIDQGARAFKLDGANQINFHPDRKWGNGMDDEEMHNLYPLLYGKQMSLGFRDYTGKRAMIYTPGGYAGIQQFCATWAGDTGGGHKPLVSMLNHGLAGHSNVSCDMETLSPAGIHSGFFQAWSQLSGWAYYKQPWFLGEKLQPIFTYYARLRYRLLPYIYSLAHVAAGTGLPMMRAMPLAFPDDPQSDGLLTQYMFGDAFLVAAFTDQIHLPEGRWIDFWTGDVHDGPKDFAPPVPEDRGGPLFVRAGAIIPQGPDMDYVGQKPFETLSLHVWPHGESAFTLYEDDGETYAYLKGDIAVTKITCSASDGQVTLTIAPRSGHYDGMPAKREFDVLLYRDSAPSEVKVDGRTLEPSAWRYDEETRAVRLQVAEDPGRSKPILVLCAWK